MINSTKFSTILKDLQKINFTKIGKPYLQAAHETDLSKSPYMNLIKPELFDKVFGSIYLHYPYCIRKCLHCHYYKNINNYKKHGQVYYKHWISEIENILKTLDIRLLKTDTIHFGGGSPSLIKAEKWPFLIKDLSTVIDFNYPREIAIEVDPVDVCLAKVQSWEESFINRISLGIQSFNDDVLKMLRRGHDKKTALKAYDTIKKSSICNINIDLMYGMPNRHYDSWFSDIEQAIILEPSSITCYPIRFNKFNSNTDSNINSEIERFRMQKIATKLLLNAGYIQYSPNQFIKNYEGVCLAKNNRNRCLDVLGIGPHAHSIISNYYFENDVNDQDYINVVSSGKLCKTKFAKLSIDEEKRRFIEFGLKLSGFKKSSLDNGIICQKYENKFNSNPVEDFREIFDFLLEKDLVKFNGYNVYLTDVGVYLGHEVIKLFSSKQIDC